MSFGTNLEMMRRRMGIQIFQLERYCGIPKQRLSEFESEKANPTLTEVLALAYVFSTTPQELLDMAAPEKKGMPKQNVPTTNKAPAPAAPKEAAKTVKSANTPQNSKDAKKQNAKKQENKSNGPWSEDDVTAALMQLQTAGTSNQKEQSSTSSKPVDSAQIQQQAMAHVANTPATNQKEKKSAQVVPATNPSVAKQTSKTQGKVETQDSSKSFIEKMKEARVKLNLSYPRICKQLGIRTMEYIQLESGAVQPSAELKAKICEVLQIN